MQAPLAPERGVAPCKRCCRSEARQAYARPARYLRSVIRLPLALGLLLALLIAAPASAHAPSAPAPSATAAQEEPTQTTPTEEPTETTPTEDGQDDPDEEEIGREIPDIEPEEEEEPVQEEAPPAPVAAPAQELPRTGTDPRLFAIAGLTLLAGFALRRVTRPS